MNINSENLQKELNEIEESLQIAEKESDRKKIAYLKAMKSGLLSLTDRKNEALPLIDESIKIYDELGLSHEKHRGLLYKARILRLLNKKAEALKLLEKAHDFFLKHEKKPDILEVDLEFMNIYWEEGKTDTAHKYAREAWNIVDSLDWSEVIEDIDFERVYDRVLKGILTIFYEFGRYEDIIEILKLLREYYIITGDEHQALENLFNQASFLEFLQRYEEMLEVIEQSIHEAKRINNRIIEARSYTTLASIALISNDIKGKEYSRWGKLIALEQDDFLTFALATSVYARYVEKTHGKEEALKQLYSSLRIIEERMGKENAEVIMEPHFNLLKKEWGEEVFKKIEEKVLKVF